MPEVKSKYKRSYEVPWGYRRSILGFSEDRCVEVVEIIMQKGQRTKEHYHMEVTEMFYMASGSAKFFVNDVYSLGKVEAALLVAGFRRKDVAIAPPEKLPSIIDKDTEIVGVLVVDPQGLAPDISLGAPRSPCSTCMTIA